jgi:predicted RNA binding protein YcfA (HicA-like mRNA interferase family)
VKLPRDLTGAELAKRLARLDYTVTRQTGSHMRLTKRNGGDHHVTVPRHAPLRVGTLAAILDAVATYHGLNRDELLERLFS